MSSKILEKCLSEFQRYYLPTILPNPKYANLSQSRMERKVMTETGLNTHLNTLSDLGQACWCGNFKSFLILIKIQNISNFNVHFEGEGLFSLLHLVMFGRKALISSPSVSLSTLNKEFEHFKIAKYLIDNGIYIDIQSKWGYSCLHESVINISDLDFAEFLLKHNANPDMKNIFGDSPLISTVLASKIEGIKLLCDYGADPRKFDEYFGVTPIILARNHIEATAILNNAKRKLETNQKHLECENMSYCCVCNVSSKKKKLFICSKCKGVPRYCSRRCQKLRWKYHKKMCRKGTYKINTNDPNHNIGYLVFNVELTQGDITPFAPIRSKLHETISEKFYVPDGCMGSHRRKYQKKRNRRIKKQSAKFGKKIQNEVNLNIKFIIKVQTMPAEYQLKYQQLLCYNKSRKYIVWIKAEKQQKTYKKLFNIIKTDGLGDPKETQSFKAYFYCWVDTHNKLNILIDNVLALQPW